MSKYGQGKRYGKFFGVLGVRRGCRVKRHSLQPSHNNIRLLSTAVEDGKPIFEGRTRNMAGSISVRSISTYLCDKGVLVVPRARRGLGMNFKICFID
jgi:hypothetical protein